MSRMFVKLLDEVRGMTYEKVDNNPDDYRFVNEEIDDIKRKLKYIDMHQKKAEEFDQQKEILDCISHKAIAHYKLGNMWKFEELTTLQLSRSGELKDEMRARQALTNLGVICKSKGKLSQALEHYNEALTMAQKRNEKWCMGRLFNNIANIHETVMNFEQAIEFQKKRLEVANQLNDLDGISKSNCSLGGLYHTLGDLDSSVECYQQVQDVFRKKLKNFDTLADDAAGSDDDFVDVGGDDEEADEEEEGGAAGGGKVLKMEGSMNE